MSVEKQRGNVTAIEAPVIKEKRYCCLVRLLKLTFDTSRVFHVAHRLVRHVGTSSMTFVLGFRCMTYEYCNACNPDVKDLKQINITYAMLIVMGKHCTKA